MYMENEENNGATALDDENEASTQLPKSIRLQWQYNDPKVTVFPCNQKRDERIKHTKPFKCNLCSYEIFSAKSLRYHLKAIHEKNKEYQCPQCLLRANKLSDLNKHVTSVHKTFKPFKCPNCEYRAAIRASLKRHLSTVHAKCYECADCGHKEKWKTKLRRHIKSAHKVRILYLCQRCDFETLKKEELNNHKQEYHPKVFECSMCDFRATLQHNLTVHKEDIHGTVVKYHRCSECKFVTKRADYLKIHVLKIHREGRLYECTICNKDFPSPMELQEHKKGCHKVCSECDYTSAKFFKMLMHYRAVHLKNKELKCRHCRYVTTIPRYLNRHIKVKHVDRELLHCTDCQFRTLWLQSLKLHRAKFHQGIRFECSQCGYEVLRKNLLESHIAAVHSNSSLPLHSSHKTQITGQDSS